MNFECWATDTWIDGSWVEGSWCPSGVIPEPEPEPVVVVAREERRWPGPSYILYTDDPVLKRQKREDEEVTIL